MAVGTAVIPVFLEILASCALAYQVMAIIACALFKSVQRKPATGLPASILKPVHGIDSALKSAISSHTKLIGEYELLCGVRDGDPAAQLIAEFPSARAIPVHTQTANGKVGALIDLARAAKYPILIVNDADIRVEPDYVARVTAPLNDPNVGLVTCLYCADGDTFPARFEALGIATDFAPSTLVARLLGVDEFAMGSTMAFRRADLERSGGFEAIADYLADDYQLGHRIHGLGLKCVLSDVIVNTHIGGGWSSVWHHQVRWARTIRVSKPGGYLGIPFTFATLWALLCFAGGHPQLGGVLLMLRLFAATLAGWSVIRSQDTFILWPLIPVRDLFASAVWLVGLTGSAVLWRDQRLTIHRDGRIG